MNDKSFFTLSLSHSLASQPGGDLLLRTLSSFSFSRSFLCFHIFEIRQGISQNRVNLSWLPFLRINSCKCRSQRLKKKSFVTQAKKQQTFLQDSVNSILSLTLTKPHFPRIWPILSAMISFIGQLFIKFEGILPRFKFKEVKDKVFKFGQ